MAKTKIDLKKCLKCKTPTTLITEGKWKGTYYCHKCDSYQEMLGKPFTL